MNDLVNIVKLQGMENVVVSSLQIAEHFRKQHKHVLEAIKKALITQPKIRLSEQPFTKSTYIDSSGKRNPMYFLNRDGFSFVVMGFTGKKAMEWRWKYIEAFNKMEKLLLEKQSDAWKQARIAGKLTRHSETGTIKKLVEYAKAQGSEHADMLYVVYSRLADKMAGINKRDLANTKQLNTLDEVENMIIHVIDLGMVQGKQYKEIFQDCKQRLEWWQDCTFRLPPRIR